MSSKDNIDNIRRDYKGIRLCKLNTDASPVKQFENWLNEAKSVVKDPTAMTLSTVSPDSKPSSRIVLLKEFDESGFSFFTNYKSKKANDMNDNDFACLLFYWDAFDRQIRIEGKIVTAEPEVSDRYFESRPEDSQVAAIISPQSEEIPNRDEMDKTFAFYDRENLERPDYWGGYKLIPDYFEFWQGQESRLHDRIVYELEDGEWVKKRLAP